jgi:hypothetical protein
VNSHGGVNPRLLQGFNFGSGQGLDELSVIDEFVCCIGILCIHITESLRGSWEQKHFLTKFFNGRWGDHTNCLIDNLIC